RGFGRTHRAHQFEQVCVGALIDGLVALERVQSVGEVLGASSRQEPGVHRTCPVVVAAGRDAAAIRTNEARTRKVTAHASCLPEPCISHAERSWVLIADPPAGAWPGCAPRAAAAA